MRTTFIAFIFAAAGFFAFSNATAQPVAAFSVSNNLACIDTVFFTDQSTGNIIMWHWDFGDGDTSILQHPYHIYTSPDSFEARLTVTDSLGQQDTARQWMMVDKDTLVQISATICQGDTFNFRGDLLTQPSLYVDTLARDLPHYCDSIVILDLQVSQLASTIIDTCINFGDTLTMPGFNLVTPGSYIDTLISFQGCDSLITVNLSVGPAISIIQQDVSCFGASDGYADIAVTGGTPPYSYSWSNGATTQDISNLTPGLYSVTVTDDTGCASIATALVQDPPQIISTLTQTQYSCGGCTNAVSLQVTGGVSPYSYTWTHGGTTANLTGQCPGLYYVHITDAINCTVIDSILIVPDTIQVVPTIQPSTCGQSNGMATAQVTSGHPPFNYHWNTTPPQTSDTATNLPAGVYQLVVTDNSGCSDTASVSISDLGGPVVSDSVIAATCTTAAKGAIFLTLDSANGPVAYQWSTNDTIAHVFDLLPGNYAVTVTDTNGCLSTKVVQVGVRPIQLTFVVDSTGCGLNTGSVTATATRGTPPYQYAWSTGDTTATADSLHVGWYSVTVTDSLGCRRHRNVRVPFDSICLVQIGGTVFHDVNQNCVQDSG